MNWSVPQFGTWICALFLATSARGEWTLVADSEAESESAQVRAAEDFSIQFKIATERFQKLRALMNLPDFYILGGEERSHGKRPPLVNSVDDFFPALESALENSQLQRAVDEPFLYDLNFVQVPGYLGRPFRPSRESPIDEPRNIPFFHLYNRMRFESARFNLIRAEEKLPPIRNVLVVSGDSVERVTEILLLFHHLELLQMDFGPGEYPPLLVGVVEGAKVNSQIEILAKRLRPRVAQKEGNPSRISNTYIQNCAVASHLLAIDERAAGVNSKRSFSENLILATSTPDLRKKRAPSLHRIQVQIPDQPANSFTNMDPWLKEMEDLAKMAMRAEGIQEEVHSLPRINFDLQSGNPNSSSTLILNRFLKRGLIDASTGQSNFNVALRFWAGSGETSGMSWKKTAEHLERAKRYAELSSQIRLGACTENLGSTGKSRAKKIRSTGTR